MKSTIKHLLLLCIICGCPWAAAEPEVHFFLDAEAVEQSFEYGDADIYTITLSPSLSGEDWSVSLSLPWQQIEGRYFVNNRFPNLAYLCSQLATLSPRAKLILVRRGVVTPSQVAYCNQQHGDIEDVEASYEGLADADLFANYYLPTDFDAVSGSLGIGYKHDNGDYEEGLGTGTREVYVETSWLWSAGAIEIMTSLGYQFIVNNSTDIELKDYGYGSLDLRWNAARYLAVGVEYHYLQANADILDDMDYIDWYLQLGRAYGVSLRLVYTEYDEDGYPEEEYRANLSYSY